MLRKDNQTVVNAIKEIDYVTLLLLSGLFIVVGGITEVGVIEDIAALFVKLAGDNLFVVYTLIVWFSVLVSAFIDNIIYTATMLPVIGGIGALIGGDPTVLYFGLIIGATLGGNLTPHRCVYKYCRDRYSNKARLRSEDQGLHVHWGAIYTDCCNDRIYSDVVYIRIMLYFQKDPSGSFLLHLSLFLFLEIDKKIISPCETKEIPVE